MLQKLKWGAQVDDTVGDTLEVELLLDDVFAVRHEEHLHAWRHVGIADGMSSGLGV